MHSLGIYRTGCDFGSMCKLKHERPATEQPENEEETAAKPVSTMATRAVPPTNGGKHVLKEMQLCEISETKFTIMPNETQHWMNSNKMWLQPEGEADSLCLMCNEGHSQFEPCEDGGCHSMLPHTMACELAASAVETERKFRWVPYRTQVQHDATTGAKVMATRADRSMAAQVITPRPATRAAAGLSCNNYCTTVEKVKEKREEDACSYLYDSD